MQTKRLLLPEKMSIGPTKALLDPDTGEEFVFAEKGDVVNLRVWLTEETKNLPEFKLHIGATRKSMTDERRKGCCEFAPRFMRGDSNSLTLGSFWMPDKSYRHCLNLGTPFMVCRKHGNSRILVSLVGGSLAMDTLVFEAQYGPRRVFPYFFGYLPSIDEDEDERRKMAEKEVKKKADRKKEESAGQEKEADADRENKSCVVCLEAESCVVFFPCGHLKTCSGCSEGLVLCPLCRALIERRTRAYL